MSDGATTTVNSSKWWKIPLRLILFVMLAMAVGWTLNRLAVSMERSPRPAGFSRGVVQGALMPMAFPNLLVGNDVTIYAQNNTGLTYKLGYTVGVNAAGLFFFGLFFRRLSRLRRMKLG
jgi:hypothetical protein